MAKKITLENTWLGSITGAEVSQNYMFCEYLAGNDVIVVALPPVKWGDIIVTVNRLIVNLRGIYPPEVNDCIRKTRCMYPHWQS